MHILVIFVYFALLMAFSKHLKFSDEYSGASGKKKKKLSVQFYRKWKFYRRERWACKCITYKAILILLLQQFMRLRNNTKSS